LAKAIFIALDPISSMHMGLTNDPEVQFRAELLSHFMLRKIPNTIVDDEDHPDNDLFARKRESVKYEETRASVKLMTATTPTSAHSGVTAGTAYTQQTQPQDAKPLYEHVADGEIHNFEPDAPEVPNADPDAFLADTTTKSSHRRMYAVSGKTGEIEQPADAPSSVDVAAVSARRRDLREMFCGDAYLFQSYGLTKMDSAAAYDCIVRSGCSSSENLLSYLDHNKQARMQGICDCAAPNRDSDVHDVTCGSRIAAMWSEGLTNIDIPAFHAVKIIQALQKDLK